MINRANDLKLFDDKQWLQLLGYNTKSELLTKSEIYSPEFFLANDGNINPKNELEATIRAFFLSAKDNNDLHAKCQFPARYIWLNQRLNIDAYITEKISCPSFDSWSNNNQIDSVSLVYVSGYMSNPASFYGHLLLNFKPKNTASDLLKQTINYGALVPENENSLLYMINGLFGGYNATYTSIIFYKKNHNYTEDQLRNLWEFELNLSKLQINLLTAHTWELMGKKLQVLFFKG